jgi:hypothetical protein
MKKQKSIWDTKPAAEDYPAAQIFLTLILAEAVARRLVQRLSAARTVTREAKDLLRASQTHLLDKNNPHVAADLKKIEKGKKLSPVLLARGDARQRMPLIIADGDHRICASWYRD